MTRSEAENIIAALVRLREAATDEQALNVPVLYPAWRSGAEYITGARVLQGGTLYKVLQDHISQETWAPEKTPSLFARVLIPGGVPAWEQPESTNAYGKGDKVTHHGKTWVSDVDGNIWEPGAYGWSEVSA